VTTPEGASAHGPPVVTHNLPEDLTSFVGRREELMGLDQLAEERRLLTLTGVGGCGKSRLAIEAARRRVDQWPDGIWLTDLGSVTDPVQLPRVTAASVGVLLEPGAEPTRALVARLRRRRLLLYLDTCEHLLEATAALVETILSECAEVSVLATSREPLGVNGEAVWQVPSLNTDDAVQLFVERASLAAPGVDLKDALDDVQAVCARVDQLPLAVELAAAWTRALTPTQIVSGLDDSFRLLTGSRRRAVARHQTLQASMDWSHELLAEDERTAFRRLAVFSGGFTLAEVQAVCDTDDAVDLELLARLIDKSLIVAEPGPDEARFRLLDTVRQYAEERLRAAGEVETTRDRHLDHFLRLAEEAEPGLDSDQDVWREILHSRRDNIEVALEWGLSSTGERSDRGRRLAAAMARQWFVCGQSAEGLTFLARAIELAPEDRSALQGRLEAGAAMLGMISGRTDLVTDAAERGLEISRVVGDDRTRARCMTMAAYPWFFTDFERCQALATEARAAGEASGDAFARDWATVLVGYTLETRNRLDEAADVARVGYENSWARGDRFCAAFARGIDLFVRMLSGDLREAEAIGHEIVDMIAPLADYFARGTNTANAALAIAMAGHIDVARNLMDPIVSSLDDAVDVDVVGFMVTHGLLHLWDGDCEGAVQWFERGTRLLRDEPRDWTATRCLPGLVTALRRLGRVDEAAEYAATGVTLATEHQAPHELSNLLDEQARMARGDDATRARDLHHQALALRVEHGLRLLYVDSIDALAWLDADTGLFEDSVRLLAISEAARHEMGFPRPPVDTADHDALVARLHEELSPEDYEAAWQDGPTRSLEDTVASLMRGRGPRGRPPTGWEGLTPTELEIIGLLVQGRSNPEIAKQLLMSRGTVKAHLTHVYAKLDVANRTELATLAAPRLDIGDV